MPYMIIYYIMVHWLYVNVLIWSYMIIFMIIYGYFKMVSCHESSCSYMASLLIILTIWVLLSILFPAFPAFHFPLSLPSSYSSSRCWLKMFDWKGATCFRWERFQTIWMHEVLWPHARANPGVHPLAFGLEPAGFSSQWAALPTNSLTTLAPSTACFKIEE